MVKVNEAKTEDEFQRSLQKLKELLGGMKGGAETKHYRIVRWNDEFIPPEKGGMFKGRNPKAAARKALRSHLNPKLPNGQRKFQEVKVTILEVTRGSKRKEHGPYIVKRVKLEQPKKIKMTNKKTGKQKTFTRTHKFVVEKIEQSK